MEKQRLDNETLAAYVHHFKTTAKWLSDSVAIHIFVKGLWDAHTTAAKIYKKDPQTLFEVIRIVEKFNAAQQVTATLTPFMVSMISNDDSFLVCGQTGHFDLLCPSAQCSSSDEFSHFVQDCPNKISPSGTHTTETGLIPGYDTPSPKGTDHNSFTTDTDVGVISTNPNNTANPTVSGAAAVTEGTHHALHPATTVVYATLWLTDTLITTHAETHPTGIIAPHLKHATSTDITHASTPQIVASLTLATLTALHEDYN